VWNADDVAAIHRSLGEEKNGKYMELPTAHYASYPYDRVLRNGRTVGVSTYLGYLFVDRAWVSLAVVDETEAELGRELTVVWGEENGGSNRPLVERHVQMEARATVAAWPFSKLAQQGYRQTIR
jgi:syringate O-demethylase/vanillate/3-O-methylgallate O-demethylase